MTPPCSRCGEKSSVYIPSTPRCMSCFQQYLERTFKSSLGHLNLSGRGPPPWVAVSGGANSCALALLLHNYIHTLPPHPKYPTPQLNLIHIQPNDTSQIPQSIVWLSKLPLVKLHTTILPSLPHLRDSSDESQLLRDAYIRAIVQMVTDQPKAVLLGTSASRAAADILMDVIAARAGRVLQDSSAKTYINDICVARPIRDIATRLLIRYARMKMPHVPFPPAGMLLNRTRNEIEIHRDLYLRVEKFISNVEIGNPAAVHNVIKTAAKLKQKNTDCCMLCGGPGIEKKVAQVINGCQNADNHGCGNCGDGNNSEMRRIRLCRGCETILERAEKSGNGESIRNLVQIQGTNQELNGRKKVGLEEMRKEIEDFLL